MSTRLASALQGLKHAVPKQILQLMNVEGMTRENVASHLQKYRLHLKPSAQGSSSLPPEQPPPPKAQQFDQQVGLPGIALCEVSCRFWGQEHTLQAVEVLWLGRAASAVYSAPCCSRHVVPASGGLCRWASSRTTTAASGCTHIVPTAALYSQNPHLGKVATLCSICMACFSAAVL